MSNKRVKISVEWGYEPHELTLSVLDWAQLKDGKSFSIDGDGYWYEGEFFSDSWSFGGGTEGSLVVRYGDDGAIGFEGKLSDAKIAEHD